MVEAEVSQLKRAVEQAQGRAATFVRSISIREDIPGGVREGTGYGFALAGTPTANRAYVWVAPIAGRRERRTSAVLHHPPVDGPQAGFREVLVAVHRER